MQHIGQATVAELLAKRPHAHGKTVQHTPDGPLADVYVEVDGNTTVVLGRKHVGTGMPHEVTDSQVTAGGVGVGPAWQSLLDATSTAVVHADVVAVKGKACEAPRHVELVEREIDAGHHCDESYGAPPRLVEDAYQVDIALDGQLEARAPTSRRADAPASDSRDARVIQTFELAQKRALVHAILPALKGDTRGRSSVR